MRMFMVKCNGLDSTKIVYMLYFAGIMLILAMLEALHKMTWIKK